MNSLRTTLSVMFLLLPAPFFSQAAARANQSPTLCKVESLPADIQNRLKEEYGSWKVQEPADLSRHAHERWESEKPLGCPGIAIGHFESAEPVWDCAEAARFLWLHPKTVKRMARSDQIPGCRLGRRWYFRPSDLDALLRTGVSSSPKANRVAPQLSSNPKRRA